MTDSTATAGYPPVTSLDEANAALDAARRAHLMSVSEPGRPTVYGQAAAAIEYLLADRLADRLSDRLSGRERSEDGAVEPTREQLARDLLSLAQRAGVPSTFWETDSRLRRAREVLGLSASAALAADWSRPETPVLSETSAVENTPVSETSESSPSTGAPAEVWTDGACRLNPGPGGWGWVTPDGREGSGSEPDTTNQRMELRAALEAIRNVAERPLVVVSDSRYVVDAFNKRWWEGWLVRDWVNSQGKPVANRDLWEPLIALVVFGGSTASSRAAVDSGISFRWVKGHAGHALNERADALAVAARETL